jgi:hypothetical protein
MTTFIHRGLLNPPSGVEDSLSLGTLSRHVEDVEEAEATLAMTAFGTPHPINTSETVTCAFLVEVGGVNQTDLSIEIRLRWTSGATRPAEPTIIDADGWTAGSWSTPTSEIHAITFTRATHAIGSSEIVIEASSGTTEGSIFLNLEANSFSDEVAEPTLTNGGVTVDDEITESLEIAIDGTPEPVATNDDLTITVTIDVVGSHTDLVATVEIAYDTEYESMDAPTNVDLDGWSQSGSWDDSTFGLLVGTFTKATHSVGQSVLVFTVPTYAEENITLDADVESNEAANVATTDVVWVEDPITWEIDATSGKAYPADATEWADFISYHALSAAVPDLLWNMQEASGNLADSIGSFTGTASGTGFTYQSAVSGLSRDGVKMTATSSGKFANTDSGLPDIASASFLVSSDVIFHSSPGTYRNVQGIGTTTKVIGYVKNVPDLQVIAGSNASAIPTGIDPTGTLRPHMLQHDETNSAQRWATDQQVLTPTFSSSVTGKGLEICGGANLAHDATTVYTVAWFGSDAEMSRTTIKALMVARGFSPPWTP